MGDAIYLFALTMEPETRTLARGLRARDPELLDGLIAEYEYRLYRYLLYLTSSPDTARELFQETWLRVLARGHQYDGESRFDTWLFAIARNLVIDSIRRRRTESLDEMLDCGNESRPVWEPHAPEASSPAAILKTREDIERLGSALNRIPAVYREVMLLRFQEDMSLEEIAALVKVPLSTVKSRLYRGLSAARELLEENKR